MRCHHTSVDVVYPSLSSIQMLSAERISQLSSCAGVWMLTRMVPQCLQSFLMDGFSCHECFFIKRFSDTVFQMVDTTSCGGRHRNHMSEGLVVPWYHVIRQQIKEFYRKTDGWRSKFSRTKLNNALLSYSQATQIHLVCMFHSEPFWVIFTYVLTL